MKKKLLKILPQIVIVLVVAALLVIMAGGNPLRAIKIFFQGTLGNLNGFMEIFVKATPLIFLGLGVSVSFRTGFFNIGAEGQLYMGAVAATATVLALPGLPGAVRIILATLAAFVTGGLWALIPAMLKRKMNISETVTTIMFNYIAIMIVGILVRGPLQDKSGALPQTPFIPDEASLPLLAYPTRLHLGVVLAIASAILLYILLTKTTVGYELKIVGTSPRAAFCMGLPITQSLIISALLGGGLAGMAGMNEVLGVQHRLLEGISSGNGYTAVLVALLARNHPIGVVIVSVLLAAVQVGANTMQRQMGIPASIVNLLIGFIVVMVLSQDIVKIYREHKKAKDMEVNQK